MEISWTQAVQHIRKAQEMAGPGEVTRNLNVALASLSYVAPDNEEFDRLSRLTSAELKAEVEQWLSKGKTQQ